LVDRFGILCVAPDWTSPPRTARQLIKQGAEVCIVAPPGSYAALTRFKTADLLMPAEEIDRNLPAIARMVAEDFGAHSILAGDNAAFTYLAQLMTRLDALELNDATRAMLRRSIPEAKAAAIVAQDSMFIVAQGIGPHAPPRTIANPSIEAALQFAAEAAYPVVVKRDGYAAGKGVTICASERELRDTLSGMGGLFVVQRFVPGVVYGVAVSGVSGKAAAAVSFCKHQVWPDPHGPATVIRGDQRGDLIGDACRLYDQYRLNGYAGFDYVVDADGRAYLLEVNPYVVEGHVSACFGCDLTAAMLAAIRGGKPPPALSPPTHELVAMFPNEWRRDQNSPHLATAHHDVPWDDPDLMAAMVRDCGVQPPQQDASLVA